VHRVASIEFSGIASGVCNVVVGSVYYAAAALIDNPTKWHRAAHSQIGQQPDYRALVLLFRLFDRTADNKLIENLPHRHRMIGLENGNDRVFDGVDIGAGSPVPLY
jgi:hypothetical protein